MKKDSITDALLKNTAPVMFCLIIVLGFYGVLFCLLAFEYPAANKDFIASLSKTMETILVMAIGFFFGSNSSSKAKDETISDIAKMPAVPVAPVIVPNADSVTVETKEGAVNVDNKLRT